MPRDFETVLLKAMAKEPGGRYATAKELADELRRFLEHKPITARRIGRGERLVRWAVRKPAVAGLLAAVFLVMAAGTAASTWQAWRATRAEGVAWKTLGEVKTARAATAAALKQSEEARAQAEAVSTFLTLAFRSPDPARTGRNVKVADVLDRASERLEQQFAGSQATKAALLDALGTTYRGLGLYGTAVSLHTEAATMREAVLGPTTPIHSRAAATWPPPTTTPAGCPRPSRFTRRRSGCKRPGWVSTTPIRSRAAATWPSSTEGSAGWPRPPRSWRGRSNSMRPSGAPTTPTRYLAATAWPSPTRRPAGFPMPSPC